MKLLLSLLLFLPVFAGCATKRVSAPSPQYAGVTRKAEDISKTIQSIQSDSKEVKQLQIDSMSLLDQLDHKMTMLLEK